MEQYSILLYSKFSNSSMQLLDLIKSINANLLDQFNIKMLCVDNKIIRKKILNSSNIQIKSVPCMLTLLNNGVIEQYDANKLLTFFTGIAEKENLRKEQELMRIKEEEKRRMEEEEKQRKIKEKKENEEEYKRLQSSRIDTNPINSQNPTRTMISDLDLNDNDNSNRNKRLSAVKAKNLSLMDKARELEKGRTEPKKPPGHP